MGDSLFQPFWQQWLSDLALKHNAVIISPNYRLLPEAIVPQIFEDTHDFWTYLHSAELGNLLKEHHIPTELDLARVLVVGESAGGLLGVSTALSYAEEIRSAFVAYPLLDIAGRDFMEPRDTAPLGHSLSEDVYYSAMSVYESNSAVSSAEETSRLDFMFAVTQHGHLGKLYQRGTQGSGQDRVKWFPFEALEADTIRIPRGGITILHGKDDTVVPVIGSRKFVERAAQVLGSEAVRLIEMPGEHGFDVDVNLDEPWLVRALSHAILAWLE